MGGTRNKGVLGRAVALVVVALLLPVIDIGAEPAGADTPVAQFDWSMPERFADHDGDGLLDYVDGTADVVKNISAKPPRWRVDLDACASGTGLTFEWRVIDQPDPASPIAVQGGPDCDDFFLWVPEEGAYRVELRASDGDATSAWTRREVVVQDFLIVSLGDSYGSGEGSPDRPVDTSALAAADEAWKEVDRKFRDLLDVQIKVAPVHEATAYYNARVAERAANTHCGEIGSATWNHCAWLDTVEIPWALAEAIARGVALALAAAVETVIDTLGKALALAESLVAAATQSWEAVKLVAKSITGGLSATWQNEQCHRSGRSGSALAAREIEARDPRTSVTFVHLACSGATMKYGLLGAYAGVEPPNGGVNEASCAASPPAVGCVPPQIDTAKQLIGEREVDAVYVSVGGNDAHFADIIVACILQEPCSDPNASPASAHDFGQGWCGAFSAVSFGALQTAACEEFFTGVQPMFDSAGELVDEGVDGDSSPPANPKFPGLAQGYAWVSEKLAQTRLVPADRNDRVFLSHYVDALRDNNGALCGEHHGVDSLPGVTTTEAAFIEDYVIDRMFGGIASAASTHGWTYVDGVQSRFRNFGYCAANHFLVRAQETFLIEGRYQGMVHPNYAGHERYAEAILEKLRPALYPTGDLIRPRRPDQPVFADAGGPYAVTEGTSATLTNETWDSDGDAIAYDWTHDQGANASLSPATAAAPTLSGVDDVAAGTVTLTASDADGSRTDMASFTVANAAPVLGAPSGAEMPVLINTAASLQASFADAGVLDTHTATIDWGDGSAPAPATISESNGSGTVSGSHVYTATGIYTVTFHLRDDDGGEAVPVTYEYVVVYDPEGGFVTGGGWFNSPPGAYTPAVSTDADVTGRANFGFVSKYQKGKTIPEGNTSFRFQAADLDFSSTSYDWMVISGQRATYRGVGTVNDVAGYAFQISATDGGNASPDLLRVRIWDKESGFVLYDNQAAAKLDAAPVTAIGAGAVTVVGPK